MTKSIWAVRGAALLLTACAAHAQLGRTLDWTTFGGDAQRTGWEKSDSKFTKDEVAKQFQLLWKVKPENPAKSSLLAPVIIGNLIGYRGFKELAFIATSDDAMYVMDADLNRMYWQKRYGTAKPLQDSAACTASNAMPTLMTLGFRRRVSAPGGAPVASPAPRPAPNPNFGPRAIYLITADGMLRRVNVANGAEAVPPVAVLPAGARPSVLNMFDNVIYATTNEGCGGAPTAVWAVDISNPDQTAPPVVKSLKTQGGPFVGLGGPVVSNDGTVYVQTGEGAVSAGSNQYSNTLLALSSKDLEVKGYFTAPPANVTPVTFTWQDREFVVSATKDGRLNLLDSSSFEGDHKTPLSQTAPLTSGGGSIWGGLSSWQEEGGTRWVLATVWGGAAGHNGSVVALKLEEKDGKPVLSKAWESRDLVRPVPPVIANGVVFALSNGDGKSTRATLYALDALTGKEIWSTGSQVTSAGNLSGLTIANGRVYFATADGTLWVFGVPLEI